MKFVIQVFVIVAIGLSSVTSSNAGEVLPEGRIHKGKDAAQNEFPYMVGIHLTTDSTTADTFKCGGSLIGNKWVLTAAHCLEYLPEAIVSLGALLRNQYAVQHIVSSEKFILHPSYNSTGFVHDIALIEIPLTSYREKNIKPVRLPSFANKQLTYEGVKAAMSGWGRITISDTKYADRLQWTEFEVIANSVCAEEYGAYITAAHICTATDGGRSACRGDSGSPLVVRSTNTQIGVHSSSYISGCPMGEPNVNTRVSSYLEWIKQHTGISY